MLTLDITPPEVSYEVILAPQELGCPDPLKAYTTFTKQDDGTFIIIIDFVCKEVRDDIFVL